mgnify:CR=1 FL=1|tara:strand:+ start:202 stop:447 length:246 start_codon:yes stop_codon:yes gene_type:complete
MKQFKQIIILLIFGTIPLFNVKLYSSNSNTKNYIQHQKEAKPQKKKVSSETKKEKNKETEEKEKKLNSSRTRTYNPPKKDK